MTELEQFIYNYATLVPQQPLEDLPKQLDCPNSTWFYKLDRKNQYYDLRYKPNPEQLGTYFILQEQFKDLTTKNNLLKDCRSIAEYLKLLSL